MSTRGQKFTVQWRQPIYYADFMMDFSKNPDTGALATVTNEDSIGQSIRNLVETSFGERPGRNGIGSKVASSLFNPSTPFTLDVLRASVLSVIENHEPRADSVTVDAADQLLENAVTVTVTYRPVNLPQTVTLTFDLKRIR